MKHPNTDKNACRTIEDLRSLMAALRNPQNGCPWDKEQNFRSLAPYVIEEAYEVADAIHRNNSQDLCEELGDLLLQIVFHARIAEEAGLFAFPDIVQAISRKLIRRHPHIFGSAAQKAAKPDKAALKQQWEAIKAQEKAEKMPQGNSYYLDDVSSALPAVLTAEKLQQKAEQVGFDWVEALPVLQKTREELAELQEAIMEGNAEAQAAEYGDVLFTLINLGRKIGADFEGSLHRSNQKFRSRFNFIEDSLKEQNKILQEADCAEMEALWQAAKQQEKLPGKAG